MPAMAISRGSMRQAQFRSQRRRPRLRGLGRLGQLSGTSWWDLLTTPPIAAAGGSLIDLYNQGVASSEAAKNPANFPMASTDALNQALATAQQNGVDPSVIQSLWMAGADAVQLQIAASSPTAAAAALAPGGALQSITGVTPVAGEPSTSALLYPAPAVPQYDTSLPALISAPIYGGAGSGASSGGAADWFSQNWPWLALGAISVWWLTKEL